MADLLTERMLALQRIRACSNRASYGSWQQLQHAARVLQPKARWLQQQVRMSYINGVLAHHCQWWTLRRIKAFATSYTAENHQLQMLAAAERGAIPQAGDAGEARQFSSLWDAIPPECKALVYSHLSQRAMACAARVSRGFAEDARAQRASVTFCDLPKGALAGLPVLKAMRRTLLCVLPAIIASSEVWQVGSRCVASAVLSEW